MLLGWLALIIVAIAFIAGIVIAIKDSDGEAFWVISIGIPFFTGIVWFFLSAIIGSAIPKTPVYERANLHNISDKIGQEGSFFIGIGGFEEDGKFFYYEDKNGVLKWKNIESENAEIHTSDQPYLMNRTDCKSKWSWLVECVYWDDYVQFFVPQGTVKQDLKLDNN